MTDEKIETTEDADQILYAQHGEFGRFIFSRMFQTTLGKAEVRRLITVTPEVAVAAAKAVLDAEGVSTKTVSRETFDAMSQTTRAELVQFGFAVVETQVPAQAG